MLQIRIAAILCLAALGCLIATSQSGPRKLSSFDPQVNALLAKMTLDEKIGQMTQPDQIFLKSDEDIEKYYLGIGVERRRFRPQGRQQPGGLDQPDRPLSEARAGNASVDSAAVRRRRRARPQQRSGRGDLPA